ncbi:carbohydrate ABC transporter permease [Polyangium jinanense]|uniref:Carbohydrate ABC transporter permease n=1 Tax=Polyangium jinanense TaxID=2829994 RepID=A0A9X4AST5_9BACT|nr:carbohydrate ABC transporter permease [Polyangium jinanense]MDC3955231.1 carbohydrate ABC transporter permease [Polyangium jinanense]MDC3981532.1 carbohydrate ABC transporter permease [Polyangium jinanense]
MHLFLIVGSLVFVFPVLWMLSTSLKPIEQTLTPEPVWLPRPIEIGNYASTIAYIPFLRYALNTVFVCALATIGTTLSSALVAFSFTRLEWPGRNLLFGLTLATMMVPFPVVMVPLYSVYRTLGWIGSLKPLWVPTFFGSAFSIFLLRQFFMRIPKSLPEAMTLDGASEFRIFWQMYLPLSKAPLVVVAFFQLMYSWNDLLGPLLFLTDQSTFTLTLGLQAYQSQEGGTQWHYLMAASVMTTLPIVVLFFIVQRALFQGMSSTQNFEG